MWMCMRRAGDDAPLAPTMNTAGGIPYVCIFLWRRLGLVQPKKVKQRDIEVRCKATANSASPAVTLRGIWP